MAAVDEQTLLHDVEQRFLRLSQKLEACEKERDDLRASQGKSDEQISALTLSQSAALRGEADASEKRSAAEREASRLDAAYKAALERAERAELSASAAATGRAAAEAELAGARSEARAFERRAASAEAAQTGAALASERAASERRALEDHAAWLQSELDARTKELRDRRRSGPEKGDASSLQHECSARARVPESI